VTFVVNHFIVPVEILNTSSFNIYLLAPDLGAGEVRIQLQGLLHSLFRLVKAALVIIDHPQIEYRLYHSWIKPEGDPVSPLNLIIPFEASVDRTKIIVRVRLTKIESDTFQQNPDRFVQAPSNAIDRSQLDQSNRALRFKCDRDFKLSNCFWYPVQSEERLSQIAMALYCYGESIL